MEVAPILCLASSSAGDECVSSQKKEIDQSVDGPFERKTRAKVKGLKMERS
ncbi:putative WD repeat-containing protein 35 [Sesbania bispinosa]|nr:putative WD repeat-containing protein 35 [Sesbania bispinosa]